MPNAEDTFENDRPRLEVATNRFADPDAAYRMLIDAHRGLSDEASADLNARLILILINQTGDPDLLAEAIELAKKATFKVLT